MSPTLAFSIMVGTLGVAMISLMAAAWHIKKKESKDRQKHEDLISESLNKVFQGLRT